jgi:hypothetical protein
MAAEGNIEVTVVVSGAPHPIRINAHEKVGNLIRQALADAGVHGGDIAGWTLRFQDGRAIPSGERIAEAGIAAGATLFLDPDEGGGGEVLLPAGTEEEPPPAPVLVDPAVSARKLARQLEDWEANAAVYTERGWQLLGSEGLHVDVGFSSRLPVGPFQDLVAIPLAVRISFENYDVWAPSVRVIDPITRRWLGVPRLRAPDFANAEASGTPTDLFIDGHPETGRVFLCMPGVREYHSHPEHSGDDWLLYRGRGFGTLGQLCEVLWRLTTRSVTGLNFVSQRVAIGEGAATVNQGIELRQENVDQLTAQVQAQMAQVPAGQMPAEIEAQLQALFGANKE